MNKALLIPILSFVALVIKTATGYEIPNEVIDAAAEASFAILTLVGIFMQPKAKPPDGK